MVAGRLRTFAIVVAIAFVAMLVTRQFGNGHAPHGNYRAQVDALLDGRLALSASPDALAHDLAWTEHGVQQVWGLGVAIWQLPFELLGRLVGWSPFPDRVAMFAWLALALFVVVRGTIGMRGDEPRWLGYGTALIVIALPGFVALLRGRLGVYEEAALYAYGAEAMLLGGLVGFVREPAAWRYVVLVGLAGFAGFLRPTVWFYGLATAVAATAYWVRAPGTGRKLRIVALASTIFVGGGALLYASNVRRFGDGLEFGHRLNVHSLPGNIVATRFDNPFARGGSIDLIDASSELFGGLFGRPELRSDRRGGFYQGALHFGQQGQPRWREYYFTTYRWPYVPLLVGGVLLALLAWRRDASRHAHEARWLGLWAGLALVPLIWFYLWSPSLSSRYQLDLGPGFAALIVIVWRAIAMRATTFRRGPVIVSSVLALAWLGSIATDRVNRTRAAKTVDGARAAALAERITTPITFEREWPASYTLRDPLVATYTDVVPYFEACTDETGEPIACELEPSIGDTFWRGYRDELGWTVVEARVDSSDTPVLGCPVPLDESAATTDGAAALPDRGDGSPDTARCELSGVAGHASDVRRWSEPRSLYLNGSGWDLATGRVPPATHFYVESPRFIEVEVTRDDASRMTVADTAATELETWSELVHVAVGLEHLNLVRFTDTRDGVRLFFEPKARRSLRPGLHVAFVALGHTRELDQPVSSVRLLGIRWR